MSTESHHKITPQHLARKAFVYIRQSTVRQVFENTESTKRQYDLHKTATSLGWPAAQIVVIDSDLGQSGASRDREGFQKLVAEVGLGNAGVVLSLEVSRLARNSSDWHQLLEICALTHTLIVDEAGLYDPSHFNDRLLLGLKGTMSEAELHVMRARLRGGLLNKARRGELECPLPIGFVYDPQGHVVLDPDKQVQDSVRLLFRTFAQTGAAFATAAYFHEHALSFPRRVHGGARHGELVWGPLRPQRVHALLHNPRYAGAFAYGRKQSRGHALGRPSRHRLPRDQWLALVLDAHPAYITWEQHEAHLARLRETRHDILAGQGPAREGAALLQGVLICGACGSRMSVSYQRRRGQLFPLYSCRRPAANPAGAHCCCIPGATLDAAVAALLVSSLTPTAVGMALDVEQEILTRIDQTDRLRQQQLERARYQADVARRRFMQVDPDNRLVASSLEAEWNEALRVMQEAQQALERERNQQSMVRDPSERQRMLALCEQFPKLWRSPDTPQRERKRILRLLINNITVHKDTQVCLNVQFRGGATTTLSIARPRPNWQLRKTDASIVSEIDSLLSEFTYAGVAAVLNERHRTGSTAAAYNSLRIKSVVVNYHLKTPKQRLHDAGMIGVRQLASRLGVGIGAIYDWQRQGVIDGKCCNDRGERMYDPLTQPRPPSIQSPLNTVSTRSTPGGAV